MKKFQFLLLDTGPIIKLFELGVWDKFIEKCDVAVTQTVADEAKYASQEFTDIRVDLDPAVIKIIDVDTFVVADFYSNFDLLYKADIDPGERETLAYMCNNTKSWFVCSSDRAVFRILGLLGRGNQGTSLEELLSQIGLSQQNLEWQYSKKFREKYTLMGQVDSIQDKGLR